MANDYTIRFNNTVYQLLPPALPGLCGGRVIMEQRLDGNLHIRFRKKYLKYEILNCVNSFGALRPTPRSLTPSRIPAHGEQSKSRTAETMRPCAVHPTAGRSGRTPAEPYPSDDTKEPISKEPWRPAPEHPWRKFRVKRQAKEPDISIGAK